MEMGVQVERGVPSGEVEGERKSTPKREQRTSHKVPIRYLFGRFWQLHFQDKMRGWNVLFQGPNRLSSNGRVNGMAQLSTHHAARHVCGHWLDECSCGCRRTSFGDRVPDRLRCGNSSLSRTRARNGLDLRVQNTQSACTVPATFRPALRWQGIGPDACVDCCSAV